MKSIKKNFMFCIFVLFMSLLIIYCTDKTHMINAFNGEIIYIEDLKEGDFIEAGAVLSLTENYHFVSAGLDYVSVCFSEDDGDTCFWGPSGSRFISSDMIVPSYYDIFNNDDNNYNGWTYKKIVDDYYFYILLVPSNDMSEINESPTFENEYEFEAKCMSGDKVTYAWYKSKEITNYSVSSNTDENIKLEYNDDVFLLDRTLVNEDNEIVITFEFEASKGDIVSFESRGTSSMNGERPYKLDESASKVVYLNGIKVLELEDYLLFKNSEIVITDSGKQQLQFVLEDLSNYYYGLTFYIKNLHVSSLINADSKLDSTKVSLGDKLYYSATCSDGYVLSGNISYDKEIVAEKKNDDENIDGKEDNGDSGEKNPNTSDIAIIGSIIVIVAGVLLTLVNLRKLKELE